MQAHGQGEDHRVVQAGQAGLYGHMTPEEMGAAVQARAATVGTAWGNGRELERHGGTFDHAATAPAPARVDLRFVDMPQGHAVGVSPLAWLTCASARDGRVHSGRPAVAALRATRTSLVALPRGRPSSPRASRAIQTRLPPRRPGPAPGSPRQLAVQLHGAPWRPADKRAAAAAAEYERAGAPATISAYCRAATRCRPRTGSQSRRGRRRNYLRMQGQDAV